MWYKNFRKKKIQVMLMATIVFLCTTLIGTSANLLSLLSVPYDALVEECEMPQARLYINAQGDESVEDIAKNFDKLSMVKKTYVHTFSAAHAGIEYKGKELDAYSHFIAYYEGVFGKVRIVEGARKDLNNLATDECFIPVCIAKNENIKVGDTIGMRCGERVYEYEVKGYFSSPYDTSVAYDTYIFIRELPKDVPEDELTKQIMIRVKEDGQEKNLENAYRKKYDGKLPGILETVAKSRDGAQLSNNILGGIFLGIGGIVFLTSCLIIYFLMKNMIQKDAKKVAIFKTMGYEVKDIIKIYLIFYCVAFGIATLLGLFGSAKLSAVLLDGMMQNMGAESSVKNGGISIALILLVFLLIVALIMKMLYKMKEIRPIYALNGMSEGNTKKRKQKASYQGSFSVVGIAMRNICRDKKGVISTLVTAVVIAFIVNFAMISLNVTKEQKNSNCFWLSIENCQAVINTTTKEQYEEAKQYLEKHKDVKKFVSCDRNNRVSLHWEEGMGDTSISTAVYETLKNSDLDIVDGREPENDKELAMGTKLAVELDKKVGDYITLDTVDGKTKDFLICGMYQSYYQLGRSMRITAKGMESLGYAYQYNYLMTYLKDGVSDKDFIEETKKEFPTVSTILRQDMYSNILNDMIVEPQEQAIPGIVALVLLVGGVSVFSIVILKNNANRMNNEIYKCIGYGTGHLIGSMLCYTSILALVAVLIALPLCYVTYPKIMILCLSIFGMEKYPFTYEFGYMLVANGGVILLFIIATLLSSLSLRKVDVRNLIQE